MNAAPLPTLVGLALALFGPPLVALSGARLARTTRSLAAMVAGQALLVALLAGICGVVRWEGRDSRSLGLGRLSLLSIEWGLALAAVFIVLLGPLLLRLPGWLGLNDFDAELARLAKLPAWYLVIAVIIGGCVEEVLYRGFAVERLAALTGSDLVAAAITVPAFAAAHLPTWGRGPALTTGISGTVLTVFFIWRGDLWSNIIAHVATDFVGIALGPLSAWFRFGKPHRKR